jgi:hypothetical protein
MGLETITYACGHTEIKQIYKSMSQRDAEVARLGQHDCPACRAAKANQASAAAGLANLVGSAKQVAWAAEIRATQLTQLDSLIAHFTTLLETAAVESVRANITKVINAANSERTALGQQSSAASIIDARGNCYDKQWAITICQPDRAVALPARSGV